MMSRMAKSRGGRGSWTRDKWAIGMVVVVVAVLAFAGYAGVSAVTRENAAADYVSNYTPPPPQETNPWPVAAFLGDSYTAGTRAGGEQNRYATLVCAAKQWRCVINGQGGTGYTNKGPGTAGETAFLDRVAALGRSGAPAVVVVQGGTNDSGVIPEVQAAATDVFNAIRSTYPDARIVAVGPVLPPAMDAARLTANRDAIAQAATASGVQFVDPIAEQWITDPALYSDDDTHLNRDGYKVYADRLLAAIGTERPFPAVSATDGRERPVVALFGDSYSEGTGADNPAADGYAARLAKDTGWDIRTTSLSGGGYRNPGVDKSGPYTRKVEAADLPAINPDLIVLQGGLNDLGYGTEVLNGSRAAISAAQAAAPGVPIVVVGLLWGQGDLTESARRPYDAIQQTASASNGVYFVDTADLRFPLTSDNTHPTTEGHALIADRVEEGLRSSGLLG